MKHTRTYALCPCGFLLKNSPKLQNKSNEGCLLSSLSKQVPDVGLFFYFCYLPRCGVSMAINLSKAVIGSLCHRFFYPFALRLTKKLYNVNNCP